MEEKAMTLPRGTSVLFAFVFAITVSPAIAQSIKLRILPVYFGRSCLPQDVQLFCTENYSHHPCLKDATTLNRALCSYPLDLLGGWSFVLVPASDWQDTLHALGKRTDTPAFSILDARVTVLESSLFTATPDRQRELLEEFGVSGQALLELAISHEIVHGVCMEKNERRVEADRKNLREGKRLDCTRALAEAALDEMK
jgi:hypothetical protein